MRNNPLPVVAGGGRCGPFAKPDAGQMVFFCLCFVGVEHTLLPGSSGCQLVVDWLSTGCRLVVDWLLTGCRLVVDWLPTRCQLAVNWLLEIEDHKGQRGIMTTNRSLI